MLAATNIWAQSAQHRPDKVQIDRQFTANTLSAERLHGFEARGQDKIQEFGEYVGLISDPNTPAEWRKHAAEMALGCFLDPKTELQGLDNKKKQSLSQFLGYLQQKNSPQSWSIEGIQTEKPLQGEGAGYRGRLTFRLTQKKGGQSKHFSAEIWLVKLEKAFGKQKQEVWELRLGKIEPLP